MTDPSIAQYYEILRRDPYAFAHRAFIELNPQTPFSPNWHVEIITAYLEQVRVGNIRRLIINLPPRGLKSHCASIVFPAWLLGHNPSAQVICVSYAQDLAEKLARDCRALMSSQFYRLLFATRISAQKQAIAEFETTQKGYRLSTSIGGVLTGRGADYVVIDDPLKPDEAISDLRRTAVNNWFDGTLYSRLNDKARGAIVLIMQRLHLDDLVGHVLCNEPWHVVSLPAIAEQDEEFVIDTPYGRRQYRRKIGDVLHPERESRETLDRTRQTIGSYNFAAQFQQNPVPAGGAMVKVAWLRQFDPGGEPSHFPEIVQSWDTANKSTELSDYSVCTTWGIVTDAYYLLHVYRERLNYPELKRAVRELAERFHATWVVIEDKASGTQLIQELKAEGLVQVQAHEPPPRMDKKMRLHAQTGIFESGHIWLPKAATWLDEYVRELTSFPLARYNDQVDSTTQALEFVRKNDGARMFTRLADPACWAGFDRFFSTPRLPWWLTGGTID